MVTYPSGRPRPDQEPAERQESKIQIGSSPNHPAQIPFCEKHPKRVP
jgi:hypothetical protein